MTQYPAPDNAVTVLKGIGAQMAAKLAKLRIVTLQDLLFHLPRQYADRTRISPIGSLQPLQSVVIEGEVRGTNILFGKRRSMVCRVQDGTGVISLRFYHFSNAQRTKLATGVTIRCYGETRRGASGLELYHPEYQVIDPDNNNSALEQTLTPVYSITEGITQSRLRSLIKQALTYSKGIHYQGLLPHSSNDLEVDGSLTKKLYYLHSPPKDADLPALMDGEHPYQQHLIMEELTAYQISLLRLRDKRLLQIALSLIHI